MAYSWRQHLLRQAKDLDAMRKGLDSTDFRQGVDWDAVVEVKHTFREAVGIERWALVEQFLVAWVDWWGLVNRWNRYFGQGQSAWPESLWRIADRCGWRVNALLRDRPLHSRLRRAMREAAELDATPVQPREPDADSALADAAVHRLLANDARLRLANLLDEQAGSADQEMLGLLKQLDRQAVNEVTSLEGGAAELAWAHVRSYRHAMLRVSWLMTSGAGSGAGSEFIDRPRPVFPPVPNRLLAQLQEAGERATRVVQRVSEAIGEIGFDAFADDVTSESMRGGGDSPLGADGIAVVRAGSEAAPADIALVISRGDARRGAQGMAASLGALIALLARESTRLKLVLFLTDNWDAQLFANGENRILGESATAGTPVLFLIPPPPLISEPFAIGFAVSGRLGATNRIGGPESAPGATGRSGRDIDVG